MSDIVFAPRAYRKFFGLRQKARQHFLAALHRTWGNNFKHMQGQPHGVIRIRYNLNFRIIARWQPPTLCVTDFVSHTEMDQDRFSIQVGKEQIPIHTIDWEDDRVETGEFQFEHLAPEVPQWQTYIEPIELGAVYYTIYDEHADSYAISADILISKTQQSVIATKSEPTIHIALEGGAGSGKTSVTLLHALYRSASEAVRYITYSQHLVNYSQSIVRQLLKHADSANDQNLPSFQQSQQSFNPNANFTIQSFHALCRELLESLGLNSEHFHPSRRITQAKFISGEGIPGAGLPQSRNQRVILWRELQQHLKGSIAALQMGWMSLDDYRNLKASQALEYGLSPEAVYQSLQIYAQHCYGWDDLDLTHALIRALNHQAHVSHYWDMLYCDEVQDFTELQLYLLLRLTKNQRIKPPSFLITGDPEQILNPSGFTWNRINRVLWHLHQDYAKRHRANSPWEKVQLPDDQRHLAPHERVPPLIFTDNFRSQADIVTLANRVRQRAQPDTVVALKALQLGAGKPLLITAPSQSIIGNRHEFGPRDALIVANEALVDPLIKQFSSQGIRTERVLSVLEIKGLEFDSVIVLGFFSWFESWQQHHQTAGIAEYLHNLLYVCVTRARQCLIFVEEQPCTYWQALADCLEMADASHPALDTFFTPSLSAEAWLESAKEFEAAGNRPQAIENYLRGGFGEDAQRLQAIVHEEKADFAAAAVIWRELKQAAVQRSAQHKHYRDSLIRVLEQMQPTSVIQAELAALYEERSTEADLRNAAQLRQALGEWTQAAWSWELLDAWAEAATSYQQAEQWLDAASCWAKLGDCAQAADCARQAGDYQGAAEYWQQAGKPLQAAAVLREAGYFEFAIAIYEDQQRYATIAEIYENDLTSPEQAQIYWQRAAEHTYRQGSRDQALRYWRRMVELAALAEDYSRSEAMAYYAAECWELVPAWSAAAEIWAQQPETLHRAAQAYEKAEQWEQAAQSWEQADDESITDAYRWEQAEHCWLKAQRYAEAGQVCRLAGWHNKAAGYFEQAECWSEAAALWQGLGQFQRADHCYRQQEPVDHRAIAQLWEAEGSEAGIELAIASWGNLGNENRIIELLLDQERWLEAAELLAIAEPERAASIYAALFTREGQPAAYVAALAIWQPDTERYWRELVRLYRCARAWSAALDLLDVHDPAAAAELYWDLGQPAAASRCWQQLEDWDRAAAVWFDSDLSQAAYLYAQRTDWLKAAALYRQAGDLTQTAKLYELAEAWALAAQTWETLEAWPLAIANWEHIHRWDCLAVIYEHQGQREAAAQAWEKVPGHWADAERCWLDLGRFAEAGRVCAKAGQFQQGAEHYSRDRDNPDSQRYAARLWQCLGEIPLAADAYVQAADFDKAAHLLEAHGYYEQAKTVWSDSGLPDSQRQIARIFAECQQDYQSAAQIRQAMGEFQAAAHLFRRAYVEQDAKPEYLYQAIQCLWPIQEWAQIETIYCDELQQPRDGGAFFAEHGQYIRAAALYQQAYRTDRSAEDLYLAIASLERLQDWNRIASIYYNGLQQPVAGAAWLEKRKQYKLAAHLLRKAGELRQAAAMWLNANDHPREDCLRYAAECYRDNSDWSDAAKCFTEIPAWPEAAVVYEALEDHEAALEIYQTHIEPKPWQAIQRCAGKLNPPNWLIVAQASEQLGNLIDAAHAYSQLPGAQHQICAAKLYTQEGRYWQAAPIWENREMWEEAKDTWKKAGQWRKAILICLDRIGTRTALLEAARIYKHNLRPKDFASAARLYFQLNLIDDAKRCWAQCANLTHLARTASGEKRFAESAAMWLAVSDWENAADAFVEAKQYCDAISALEHGKAQGLKPLKPRPSELPQPERFRGLGAAGLGASAGLAALLEAIALPVGIVAGLAWWAYDSTIRFNNDEQAYLERLKQIEDWEEYENDRLELYNQEATKKIARIRQRCGCTACPTHH